MAHTKASEIMNRKVKTVSEQATLSEVAELLEKHRISGAPVVNEHGEVVGVISEADLLDEQKRKAVIPRMAVFGLHLVPDRLLEDAYNEGFSMKAHEVMSRRVITAEEDTPVEELADLMLRKRINRVPIMRDGKLTGIVTREDVLRGLRGVPRRKRG